MNNVIAKLCDGELMDRSKNIANRRRTINGLKIWFFKIEFLFKNPKKFSPGYNFLKQLLTHWFSMNSKIEKIVVNKNDL